MPKIYTIDSKKVNAILFDFDGTLVDTEAHQHAAHIKIFSERGINYISLEEHLIQYGGRGFREIYEKLLGPLSEEEFEEIKAKRRGYFVKLIEKNGIKSIKGSLNFISKAVKLGLKLGIVTGGSKKTNDQTVRVSKIPIELFKTIVYQDDYSIGKPDPEPYLIGAKNLRVKPEDCLVFEDAPNGVRSAIAAGMDYFALTTNLPEERFKEIDPTAKTIQDFTEVKIV